MRNSPSLTTSNILSQVYNHIKVPSRFPPCSVCHNTQVERQLQQNQGKNYLYIPDRHVEIYLCGFCKKLDEPKCKHCFLCVPCCSYKQRVEYQEYFSRLKKEIIKTVTSVSQTFKQYQDRSMKDLTFPLTSYISPSSINKELMVYLADVQLKLRKQIQEQIEKNQKKLFQTYREFEKDVSCRLYPYTPQGLQRYKKDMGPDAIKNMSLQDCIKFLEQVQSYKMNLEQMGHQICDKYVTKINFQYPKTLYTRLNQAFRQFLVPKITFKDALVQTSDQKNVGSSHSITLDKSLPSKNVQTQPNLIEQKVIGLQNVIQRNFQTIKRLEQRIKDLQFIVNIQQSKNQELEFKVIEFEAKCGISRRQRDLINNDDDVEIEKVKNYMERLTNKNETINSGLRYSKSNPSLLNYYVDKDAKQIKDKQEEQNVQKENNQQKMSQSENEVQPKSINQNPLMSQSLNQNQQKEPQIKRPRKISQGKKSFKDKSEQSNNSWLEELVNQIKQ